MTSREFQSGVEGLDDFKADDFTRFYKNVKESFIKAKHTFCSIDSLHKSFWQHCS